MELYDEEIEKEILNSKVPVLVEFYADWCRPCKVMEPIVKEIENELRDKIKVIIVDIEKDPKISQKFTVMSLPTIQIYKNGAKIKHLVGVQDKKKLMTSLEDITPLFYKSN